MAQVIDDPYSGNIFGRIGKGIGKGLSEQIPKEVDRYRLSSGLKTLGEQGTNLNPLQQIEHLVRSGANLQDVSQLLPMIRESQQRQAFSQRKMGQPAVPAQTQTAAATEGSAALPASAETTPRAPGLASPAAIKNYKQSIRQAPTPEEIYDKTDEFLQSGIAQNPAQAQQMALMDLNQSRQAQNEKIDTFKKGLSERMALDLQSNGLGDYQSGVFGEIQNALLDQGQYLVGSEGVSPEAAQEKISDIFKELAKTGNQTMETGAKTFWTTGPDAKARALRNQRKEFAKYGFGELFDDFATAQTGYTPLRTAHLLDPVTNKEVNKDLKSIKMDGHRTISEVEPKVLDKVIKSIKPNDNLLSIAYDLRAKRKDVDQFLKRVETLRDNGEIVLSPQQERQLKKPMTNSYLGDIIAEVFESGEK